MRRQNTGDAEGLPRGNHADFQIWYGRFRAQYGAVRHEDGRELQTVDGSGQTGEGRGTGSSALCNLPSAVCRLRLSAVSRLTRLVARTCLSATLPTVDRRRSHYPFLHRPRCELRPRRESKLPQRARDVPLHGPLSDPELTSDDAVRLPLRDQLRHVALALCEPA